MRPLLWVQHSPIMVIWLLFVARTIFDECIQWSDLGLTKKNKRLQLGSPSTCSGHHIYIYVVLAPGSMWATWQAASTGKSTPSPPCNAQASTFSYFSHADPPCACSTYLSLLVLIVHWLWVWAQVERVLLSHLMLVRAFFVLPLRPSILTSWKCWRFWEVKMFSLWAEFAQSRETSSGWTSDNSSANHSVNKPCLGPSAQVKTTCNKV